MSLRDSHSFRLCWPCCSDGQPWSRSLLLRRSGLSPPIPRLPRLHSERFHTWPNFSLLPSCNNRRVTSSAWDHGDWLNTIRLQSLSCSANLSEMPAWNRYSDKSCVTLKQHSRLRKNHSASLVYQVYLVYPALRDETDRMNKTGWRIFSASF